MPSKYTKLSPKQFKEAYANRKTSSKTLQKEMEIKKLFDHIFKLKNWGGIRGSRRNTGGVFPDDWFRKHISNAIKGDLKTLKELSRITGRKINELKDAFEKREISLLKTRSIAARKDFFKGNKDVINNLDKKKSNEKHLKITERIEKNIYKITNNKNSNTKYRVRIWSEKAPLERGDISSLTEAKNIKSRHLKDNPELIPIGRSKYKTIEKDIKFNGYNYIVQVSRGSNNNQRIFYKGNISKLNIARDVRNRFVNDNPTIINKSKIGTGKNKLQDLNRETKHQYNEGKVDFNVYKPLNSDQKRKVRDKLK
tara:strand:- start:715 stop:1644 length:930 start_codon:yes stop_codon:yes gene_type:complete